MEQHEHQLPFSSTAIWLKRTRTWNHTYSSLLWCTWKGIIVDKIASPTTTQQIHVVRSLKDRRTSKKDPHNFGLKSGILPRFFVNPSYHWHPVHQWHQCRTSRISFDPSLVWQKLSCGSTHKPQEKSENSANSKGFMSACREGVVISWFDICGLLSLLDMFRPFKVYPPKKMVKGGHAANPLNMGSILFVCGFSLNRNCCLGHRKWQCFNGDVLECLCFKLIVASMKSHVDSLFCWCKSTKLYIPNVLDIVPERYLDAPIFVKLRKFLSNFLSGVYIYCNTPKCWFKKELRGSLYNNCNLPFYKTPVSVFVSKHLL